MSSVASLHRLALVPDTVWRRTTKDGAAAGTRFGSSGTRPIRPLTVTPPLNVLVIVAGPTDFPPLNVDAEWEKLCDALAGLERVGRVRVDRAEAGTLAALQRTLRRGEYHVLHYIGHGGFDVQASDGVLAFEGPQGRAQLVSGHDLGGRLHDHRTLRLAVLNACEGARGGRARRAR